MRVTTRLISGGRFRMSVSLRNAYRMGREEIMYSWLRFVRQIVQQYFLMTGQPVQDEKLNSKMDNFLFEDHRITNFEMETAAIYGLSKLLGHEALSLNAIVANRANGTFSENPYKAVDELIVYTLGKLVESLIH